ncbi:MAG: FAD-binding protein [Sphaerochaetaceae bacterium]|nr:FAD-binding protein [Sphaerochaetaceae bacterium]MDD2405138.1 FAD-binding protein [Sphaerochaetaceae bacterium]MDD4841038.1 FAD-binding protein [Sphaerochaetaceae bacterium]
MPKSIQTIEIEGLSIPIIHTDVLVVGTGAASLSCAIHLNRLGCKDILIVTDNSKGGTSRNTGSDKQTYYRLNDSSTVADSPYEMANTYLEGGSMHGDIALVESMVSLRAFYNLIALGVPFPHNTYGGYTGYKTDHDPHSRGTSIGPYTSNSMVEKLWEEVNRRGIPYLDHNSVVRLLVDENNTMLGALVQDTVHLENQSMGFSLALANHVVFGVGGPAGFYASSVYPRVHSGGIGLALEIGAEAANLTESQFGLASTKVRWNLSGSYQQVLPRYYSTDQDGNDEQDFLSSYFNDWEELTGAIFLKGYQWPFNSSNLEYHGSSLIDLLVYHEIFVKKRRVFLDFLNNPTGQIGWPPFSVDVVDATALSYLHNSNAWKERPIERLDILNPKAIELYENLGIDVWSEPLEISLCAQHNNGGLAADIWWESTSVKHLYPVGEVNGSHGVKRPGGSALNSGQVGSIRAATRIMGYSNHGPIDVLHFVEQVKSQVRDIVSLAKNWVEHAVSHGTRIEQAKSYLEQIRLAFRQRMSTAAGPIRSLEKVRRAITQANTPESSIPLDASIPLMMLPQALKLRHMLIAQHYYLFAVEHYLANGGGSRGGYVVSDESGKAVHPQLDMYRVQPENEKLREKIQIVVDDGHGSPVGHFINCRPVPTQEFWFERMWTEFREETFFEPTV